MSAIFSFPSLQKIYEYSQFANIPGFQLTFSKDQCTELDGKTQSFHFIQVTGNVSYEHLLQVVKS